MAQLVMVLCPTAFTRACRLLWSSSHPLPEHSKEKTNRKASAGFALHRDGISCPAPAKSLAATFAALPYVGAVDPRLP